MIYFVLFFALLAGIYAYDYRKHKTGDLVAYVLICIGFIALAGLRYRLGGDSIAYENIYKRFPKLFELGSFNFKSTRYEPGFIVFGSIPKAFSPDFTYFQLFHAFVVNTVVFWFVLKNTQNKYSAILLYYAGLYLNLNMEVLRESLAVCCFLLAWPYFRDGKWWFYYPLSVLGCFFHVSAVVTLFLPLSTLPFVRSFFQLGYRTIFIGIIVLIGSYIIQNKFYGFIQSLEVDSLSEKAQLYSKATYGKGVLNIIGMLDHLLKTVFIPALGLWILKRRANKDTSAQEYKEVKRLELIMVSGFYFAIMTIMIFMVGRMNNYFGLFNYIAVASCLFTKVRLSKKTIKFPGIYWVCFLAVAVFMNSKVYFSKVYTSTHKTYMMYYPYSSRLDPIDDPNREELFRLAKHFK